MYVQDIPEDIFEAFRVKGEGRIFVECKGIGRVEKWHLATLDHPAKGVICWYETTCIEDLPVSFLVVFPGLCPEDVEREITKKHRPDLDYLIKVRCGPLLYALEKQETLEDDVSILMRHGSLSLKCDFFSSFINIMGVVNGLWSSAEKRIYHYSRT